MSPLRFEPHSLYFLHKMVAKDFSLLAELYLKVINIFDWFIAAVVNASHPALWKDLSGKWSGRLFFFKNRKVAKKVKKKTISN